MTTKPDDIQQDIWDAAIRAFEQDERLADYASGFSDDVVTVIARAIMAERLRAWQPIETAPSGKGILVCCHPDYAGMFVALKDVSGEFPIWPAHDAPGRPGHYAKCKPTHWMPLPQPPQG